MNILKPLAGLMAALSFPVETATGQSSLELTFSDQKDFLITGPSESEYQGGGWFVTLLDGAIFVLPCVDNFGFDFVGPYLLCPNGTTGLITQGDLDGDGVRDIGRYLSIDQPLRARSIAPFLEDEIELLSAPPSELPRPVSAFNWSDQSIVAFYDLVGDPINGVGYEITRYLSTRFYGPNELERHREEIVPGTYTFKFPALNWTPENLNPFYMRVSHREMLEAAPGPGGQSVVSGGINVGNDFRLLNDDLWNNGTMEIDPRLNFSFDWEGFSPLTFYGNDQLSIVVRDREDDRILYPPIPYPPDALTPNPDTRQVIGNRQLGIPTGFNIGANFFQPDASLQAELEFRRNTIDGSSIDGSVRFFRWNVDLVDTYEGFRRRVGFPFQTPAAFSAPNFDFDGDGFTNLQEFGLQTDPADPASVPNPTPSLDPITGQCFLDIEKRPAIGSSLDYRIQYSLDLETWTTIRQGDPNWFIVFDNEDQISVLSRTPAGVNPCFLRVRFDLN